MQPASRSSCKRWRHYRVQTVTRPSARACCPSSSSRPASSQSTPAPSLGTPAFSARSKKDELASPNDDEDVWGGLTGAEVGEAFGVDGLGLVGTGRGGPGDGSEEGRDSTGRGKPVPRVRQAKASTTGKLDKDIIRRIVRAHINEVRYCYSKGLVKDPKLAGRVGIDFAIGAAGKVTSSSVGNNTLADATVGKCIAKAVKRWKFPRPTDGGTVTVTYPFVLEPG